MNNEINAEDVKVLAGKVKGGTATPQEELQLLQYLNKGMDSARSLIKEVMTEEAQ